GSPSRIGIVLDQAYPGAPLRAVRGAEDLPGPVEGKDEAVVLGPYAAAARRCVLKGRPTGDGQARGARKPLPIRHRPVRRVEGPRRQAARKHVDRFSGQRPPPELGHGRPHVLEGRGVSGEEKVTLEGGQQEDEPGKSGSGAERP